MAVRTRCRRRRRRSGAGRGATALGREPHGPGHVARRQHRRVPPRQENCCSCFDNCEHLLNVAGPARREHDAWHAPTFASSQRVVRGSRSTASRCDPLRSLSFTGCIRSARRRGVRSTRAALFVDRARAARPGFAPGCDERVGGRRDLPVVSTAFRSRSSSQPARVVSMSPSEIARPRRRALFPPSLTGGRRTAGRASPDSAGDGGLVVFVAHRIRSKTVFRAVERVLGKFLSRPTRTAVVTGEGIDTWDAIDTIGSLVSKSILTTDEGGGRGPTWYRLLETLRQYARERLEDRGESPTPGAAGTRRTTPSSPNKAG